MFTFDDIDFSSRGSVAQSDFDRCHRRIAAFVTSIGAGRFAPEISACDTDDTHRRAR
jgi:hypothetical protein